MGARGRNFIGEPRSFGSNLDREQSFWLRLHRDCWLGRWIKMSSETDISVVPPPSSRWSIASHRSILSIGSTGSALSIGSVGSFGSVCSVGSSLSIGSMLSSLSLGSAMSTNSRGGVMDYRANRGARRTLLAGTLIAVACAAIAVAPVLRQGTQQSGG